MCLTLGLCVRIDTLGEKSPESVKSGESANHKSVFASGLQLSGITVHQEHPSQPNLPQETGNSVFTVLSSVTGPLLK